MPGTPRVFRSSASSSAGRFALAATSASDGATGTPPYGAFCAPRTLIGLPFGSAQYASSFAGFAERSLPVRYCEYGRYPFVQDGGLNRLSTRPRCAVPSPGATLLAAPASAG